MENTMENTIKTKSEMSKLYRVGGLCSLMVGVTYVIWLAGMLNVSPMLNVETLSWSVEGTLSSLADHKVLYWFTWIVGAVVAEIFTIPTALVLYFALKDVHKNAMLFASAFLITFALLDLTVITPSFFSLATLSENYVAATSDATRLAYIAVANYVFAKLDLLPLYVYLVPGIGTLIAGLVMLKAKGICGKGVTYFSIATGVFDIIVAFEIIVPALGFLMLPSVFVSGIWFFVAGYWLYNLGRQ
jgi:hypothetical protein